LTDRRELEALLAAARANRAAAESVVAALEAALSKPETEADELLDLVTLRKRYGIGRAAILGAVRRRELEAVRGVRDRIMVRRSAVEGWLGSRRVEPAVVANRDRPVAKAPANDDPMTAWERAADAKAGIGGRR
jgi:hypothetical protein